ncbi:conserved Plasmodium protein, unknown function [Plasmodium vinckei lentum]|uniref:Uncharacterized protein n=1 Tax=Plasmodium vinckei lentum TaxID=138297 RepID=A0A6V7SIW1_PLAVN|nr:conserved Plasmodium protein, unknown function [Plasmodium vinckei lentum]
MKNRIRRYMVAVIIIFQFFEKYNGIKLKRFYDYFNFIQPIKIDGYSKYQLNYNFQNVNIKKNKKNKRDRITTVGPIEWNLPATQNEETFEDFDDLGKNQNKENDHLKIDKPTQKKDFLNGELLSEEEINEHMRFQQWNDSLIYSDENAFYYDIENKCVNTKSYKKINQVNTTFYKKELCLNNTSINLIPFNSKKGGESKLNYDAYDTHDMRDSGKENTNKNGCVSTSQDEAKETILSEDEVKNLSDIEYTKKTNIFFPKNSLYSSIYIGKDGFNDFLEKGIDSIKMSLNKYLNSFYENNLEINLNDKIYIMFILKYAKSYILDIIYKTFQTKQLNELEIESDMNIYPEKDNNDNNNNKFMNSEVYLDMLSEYEEILNILTEFFNKIHDMFKINETELTEYLKNQKKKDIINYSTPYVLKSNEETERHIKNMWTFFNCNIFNNELPNFDFIPFYWMNSKIDNLLSIPNMKTYNITNQNFINLPNILLCPALRTSPILLNYTILKIMYEYYKLIHVDILPFNQVKNFKKLNKFDPVKQKIIKYVHGVSGLLENIDFYFYTPHLGDLNLTPEQSATFFSYIKNVEPNQDTVLYNMEYNKYINFYDNVQNDTQTQEENKNQKQKDDDDFVNDDLVFLLLKSKTTNDINKAIKMAQNVYIKKNVNLLWGEHAYPESDGTPKESGDNLKNENIQSTNLTSEPGALQKFRIPLNEFAASLFLCDVNNSTKYLTQGIDKLKELTEFDLTYVHNALTNACLKFLHDSGNENEDVEGMLKKYENNEKVETTNNIMALQMMVVLGELFRNIRKMRTKEKYFFKKILQTDVLADIYKNTSIYDENMDINAVDNVIKNIKIDYPLNQNLILSHKNKENNNSNITGNGREDVAYYFLNYYTKHLFRFDLPNNIIIKYTDNISGLSFSDYNYDYINNDIIIYINNDVNNSLLLSRLILDECLNIYEKYTTYIHKFGSNVDNQIIKEAKKKNEANAEKTTQSKDTNQVEELNTQNEETNESDIPVDAKNYTEESIDPSNVSLDNIKEVKSVDKTNGDENRDDLKSDDELIDDEQVDIFNYSKINKIKQFIRFIIEYNNWPFFMDELMGLEYYLNRDEINKLGNKEEYDNNLNNFYMKLKNANIDKNRIMEILTNSIKREDPKQIWEEDKIPIKHIASAIYTNNYINIYNVFSKGINKLLKLNMNDVDFIMNKCKYACEIVYYKRLEEIKSPTNNLLFTMYNENLSCIEYFFDKLKEKLILISLVKTENVFDTLIKLISDIFPNKASTEAEINNKDSPKTKDQVNELIFLQKPGQNNNRSAFTDPTNRITVTNNMFQYFNKEIFGNKINKNVQIEFIKDYKLLSSHANYINTFENSKIFINDNVYSINVLANVLLKEMSEIFYFYNNNQIQSENKLYLKNNFTSLYLPTVFKYSKSFEKYETSQTFNFGEDTTASKSEFSNEMDNVLNDVNGKNEFANPLDRTELEREKNEMDMKNLINRIAKYDHEEMFKEIMEYRKTKYNDNAEIQKCLEEYLYTYEKINLLRYGNQSDEKNSQETNDAGFEPIDIKTIYLNYIYKYIEYMIKKKELPISFNSINEEWINSLTELENQKILSYSTRNSSGHLYDLLINSNACSSKRALEILEKSLEYSPEQNEQNELMDGLNEKTISRSEDKDAIKNFDEFVIWINKNKKKDFELPKNIDFQDEPGSDNIKEDIRQVIDQYNSIYDTNPNKNIDPNNVTIDNLKDIVKKHNISKEDIQAAISQLDMPPDFDIDSLFK